MSDHIVKSKTEMAPRFGRGNSNDIISLTKRGYKISSAMMPCYDVPRSP